MGALGKGSSWDLRVCLSSPLAASQSCTSIWSLHEAASAKLLKEKHDRAESSHVEQAQRCDALAAELQEKTNALAAARDEDEERVELLHERGRTK